MNKISIISPCFNGGGYLKRYINGLLSQTLSNVEYIFVNDGSTDNTEAVINSYADEFRKKGWSFKYIRLDERSGQAKAINQGLAIFTGDYLCCIDSDDVIMPTYLEDMSNFLEEHKEYGVAFPWSEIIEEHTGNHLQYLKRDVPDRIQDCLFDDFILQRNHGENYVFYASFMLRASAFLQIYPNRKIYEGLSGQNAQLLLPILYNFKFGYVKKILYKAVARKNSDSRLSSELDFINRTYSWEDIYCHVLNTIPNMPDYEKAYYFARIKNYWESVRDARIKDIEQKKSEENRVTVPVTPNPVIVEDVSSRYGLFKVISYAIRGKWAFSHSKRSYYRKKLSKLFRK